MRIVLLAPLAGLLLQGCLVRTAADVVTAPVRAVGQAADWATTSQDEADRNAGRRMREEDERRGREERERARRDEEGETGDEAGYPPE